MIFFLDEKVAENAINLWLDDDLLQIGFLDNFFPSNETDCLNDAS